MGRIRREPSANAILLTGSGGGGGGSVNSVTGTANRISVGGTATDPVINIAATYAGQTSITTLGTVGTGTWNGTLISPQYGGTGVNNTDKTITLGGNLVTSGGFSTTLSVTSDTNVTLPTSGTLATTGQIPSTTGLLKTSVALDSTLRNVTDFAATASALYLSTTSAKIQDPTGGSSMFSIISNSGDNTTRTATLMLIGNRVGGTANSTLCGIEARNTANSNNYSLGQIYFLRAGSDFSGSMMFNVYNSGSLVEGALTIRQNGNVGHGFSNPDLVTAVLHLKAGTATAGSAPLKFTTGTVLTTPEAGAEEYNDAFYQTKASGLRYGLGGVVANFITDAGNSTTTETDLYSFTTPASTLAVNGSQIEAEYAGIFVSSGTATREIKIYFGGTQIFDTGALTLSLSSAWQVYVEVTRVSSTVVRCSVSLTTQGAALSAYTSYTEVTGLTLSNTNILKITGQASGVGAATNDIVAKRGSVKWFAAANL